MKKAFTIIEIIMITALLGILVAVALPAFQNHVTRARESAAKESLRIIRSAIELYAAQHDKVPKIPFNELQIINVIADNTELQAQATGDFGWIYKPQTKDFRIDWLGKDSEGINYYDY